MVPFCILSTFGIQWTLGNVLFVKGLSKFMYIQIDEKEWKHTEYMPFCHRSVRDRLSNNWQCDSGWRGGLVTFQCDITRLKEVPNEILCHSSQKSIQITLHLTTVIQSWMNSWRLSQLRGNVVVAKRVSHTFFVSFPKLLYIRKEKKDLNAF